MNERQEVLQRFSGDDDFIHTQLIWIDIAGNSNAGHLLARILYWNAPDRAGKWTKLRVRKADGYWLCKKHEDWWTEIRLTTKEAKAAIKLLVDKGIIRTKLYKFDGSPTTHIQVVWENLKEAVEEYESSFYLDEEEGFEAENLQSTANTPNRPKGTIPTDQKGRFQPTKKVDSITRNTTEITTRNKDKGNRVSSPTKDLGYFCSLLGYTKLTDAVEWEDRDEAESLTSQIREAGKFSAARTMLMKLADEDIGMLEALKIAAENLSISTSSKTTEARRDNEETLTVPVIATSNAFANASTEPSNGR